MCVYVCVELKEHREWHRKRIVKNQMHRIIAQTEKFKLQLQTLTNPLTIN